MVAEHVRKVPRHAPRVAIEHHPLACRAPCGLAGNRTPTCTTEHSIRVLHDVPLGERESSAQSCTSGCGYPQGHRGLDRRADGEPPVALRVTAPRRARLSTRFAFSTTSRLVSVGMRAKSPKSFTSVARTP